MVIPTHIAEKGAAPSFREREETRRFYTETLLHTESFTHKHFYTQTLSHRDVFHAHTHTHAQTHFHTETFTHKHFNTQTLLHTDAFTRKHFYIQALLHTDAFTHRRFSTQTFTHRRSQSAAPLGDLSCKQRCANIVAMEMPKNRKSAQDQAQYHDQRTIQCKASALWDTK